MKSIVTEYEGICFLCGRPAEAEHHLVFGGACRQLAEQDGLFVPICNNCHNIGEVKSRIHDNPVAEKLSKMLGQLAWEKERIIKDMCYEHFERLGDYAPRIKDVDSMKDKIGKDAREQFKIRYGKSYL